MKRRYVGALSASVLAWGSALGCEGQVGDEYKGEPLYSLQGNVLLSEDEVDADLVPRLMYFDEDGSVLTGGALSGDFPAKFRFDVTEPPPKSAFHRVHPDHDYDGEVAEGWLVLVPPDYPRKLPYHTFDTDTLVDCDDNVCMQTETQCTDDGRCRELDLECTESPCEVVDEWGDAELGEGAVEQAWSLCEDSICYNVRATCDTENCNAAVIQCEQGEQSGEQDGTITVNACTVLSGGGDTTVATDFGDLNRFSGLDMVATNIAIFSLTEDAPHHRAGPLEKGYNLVVQRPKDEWLESVRCAMNRAAEAVAKYNEENETNWNVTSFDRGLAPAELGEVVDEAEQACGGTYPLTRVEDPLSESLTIRIGRSAGAF